MEIEDLRQDEQRKTSSAVASSKPKRYFTTLPHNFKHDDSSSKAEKPYASTKLTRRRLRIKAQEDEDSDIDDDDWC